MIPKKEIMEHPFALCCLAGVKFSTLLADYVKYSGHTKADIARQARCSERMVKSCIQEDAEPTAQIKKAMENAIGFDPWSVYRRVHNRTYRMNRKEQLVLNQIEADYTSSVSEQTAPYFLEGRDDDYS